MKRGARRRRFEDVPKAGAFLRVGVDKTTLPSRRAAKRGMGEATGERNPAIATRAGPIKTGSGAFHLPAKLLMFPVPCRKRITWAACLPAREKIEWDHQAYAPPTRPGRTRSSNGRSIGMGGRGY